jgi:hypothetical protein
MRYWTRVVTPDLPEFSAFAHAAVAGDHIYVSGMLGLEDDFSRVVEGGITAETRQALASRLAAPICCSVRRSSSTASRSAGDESATARSSLGI